MYPKMLWYECVINVLEKCDVVEKVMQFSVHDQHGTFVPKKYQILFCLVLLTTTVRYVIATWVETSWSRAHWIYPCKSENDCLREAEI